MGELSLDNVLQVVGGIVRGEPPPPSHARRPLPWIGWLALGLVRYRARQRFVIRDLGGRKLPRSGGPIEGTPWSCAKVSSLPCMEVTNSDIHVAFRISDAGDRDDVAIDPDTLIAFSFAGATFVERHSSMVSAQIQSCLNASAQSRAELPIGGLAAWLTKRLGGRVVANPWWLQLPPGLEELARQIDPRFDEFSGRERSQRIGGWVGEPFWIEADSTHLARLRRRHLRLISRQLNRGELIVVHALPALIFQDNLTSTVDAMLKKHRGDLVLCTRLIDVLERAWVPPSRYLAELVGVLHKLKVDELELLQIAAPYMLHRDIETERVREFLRRLAAPDKSLPRFLRCHLSPTLGAELLLREPAIGRPWIRRVLAGKDVGMVREGAAILVAIGAPWCVAELRNVAAGAVHRNELLAALAHLGIDARTAEGSGPFRALFSSPTALVSPQTGHGLLLDQIQSWRARVDALSASARAVLERG